MRYPSLQARRAHEAAGKPNECLWVSFQQQGSAFRPLSTTRNPLAKNLDLGRTQAAAFRRHLLVLMRGGDALQQLALVWLSRDHRTLAGICRAEDGGLLIIAQTAVLLLGSVAFQAVCLQDRVHIADKIRRLRCCDGQRDQRQSLKPMAYQRAKRSGFKIRCLPASR